MVKALWLYKKILTEYEKYHTIYHNIRGLSKSKIYDYANDPKLKLEKFKGTCEGLHFLISKIKLERETEGYSFDDDDDDEEQTNQVIKDDWGLLILDEC